MVQLSIARWFDTPSRTLKEIASTQDLYVFHHLGLGDMIHCNGMVRFLLQQLDPHCNLHVFCKARNAEMTQWMYRDEPRIRLERISEGARETDCVQRVLKEHNASNYLCVGHRDLRTWEKNYPRTFFDQLFYMQVGIPYSVRYSHCYWERDLLEEERVYRKLAPGKEYAFVHDDPNRGYSIDSHSIPLPIVRNDISESIFHLGLLLERASQVHCMESSIRCMIESLDMSRCQLFYHNFRYPDRPLGDSTNLAWTQIDRTQSAAA